MALWLGTGKIEEENFSKYFRERKKFLEFYLNDMKFRIVLQLSSDELKKF